MSRNKPDKWYVVWRGHKPGVYSSWDKAEPQIRGYSGALHRSFSSKEEAREAFKNPPVLVNKPPLPPVGKSVLVDDMRAALGRLQSKLRD